MSELFIKICQTNEFLKSLEQIANSKQSRSWPLARRRYAVKLAVPA